MTDRLRRLRASLKATLLFLAFVVAVTWVYVLKADVDRSVAVLDRHRMDHVVLLVGLYAVGLSVCLVHLARTR